MNAKTAKKLRQYASKEKLAYIKQLYRAKPWWLPRFFWTFIFEKAFVKK